MTEIECFTIEEFIDATNTTLSWVLKAIDRGELESFTMGRKRMIPISALDRFLGYTDDEQHWNDVQRAAERYVAERRAAAHKVRRKVRR